LKWEEISTADMELKKDALELKNDALARLLLEKQQSSGKSLLRLDAKELERLIQDSDVPQDSSYIKAGDTYFRPAEGGRDAVHLDKFRDHPMAKQAELLQVECLGLRLYTGKRLSVAVCRVPSAQGSNDVMGLACSAVYYRAPGVGGGTLKNRIDVQALHSWQSMER
jgi:hypothetical protein